MAANCQVRDALHGARDRVRAKSGPGHPGSGSSAGHGGRQTGLGWRESGTIALRERGGGRKWRPPSILGQLPRSI